jgi:hypothetical protein
VFLEQVVGSIDATLLVLGEWPLTGHAARAVLWAASCYQLGVAVSDLFNNVAGAWIRLELASAERKVLRDGLHEVVSPQHCTRSAKATWQQ